MIILQLLTFDEVDNDTMIYQHKMYDVYWGQQTRSLYTVRYPLHLLVEMCSCVPLYTVNMLM